MSCWHLQKSLPCTRPTLPPPPFPPGTSSTTGHLLLSAAEEPQVEESDLWSPAAYAGTVARCSLSDDRPLSPVLENSCDAAEDAVRQEQDREEIGRLRRAVEGLEEANTSLREQLTESRLEATALRRTSLTQREAALDRVMREAVGDEEERRQARAGCDSPDEGQKEDEAEGDRPPSMLFSSSSSDVREEGAQFDETETCHEGQEDGPRPEEGGVEGPRGCRARRESGGGGAGAHRRKQSTESAATSARSFRCRSSSMFRDAQEQAELIEALRGQIAQLRLEAKATTTRAAGTEFRWSEEAPASHQHDGGAGQRRGACSSDDDSGSDRGRDTSRDEDTVGKEGGNGRENIGSRDGEGRGADEHMANPLLLRARVDELQAELETTKRALEALQRRAQQEQAVSVELQRELLRLHSMRYNSGAVAAAVARVSAGTLRPASYAAGRTSDGGSNGSSSNRRGGSNGDRDTGLERRIDCTMFEGMGWLHRLWRVLFCGRCGETAGSGVDTSFEDTGAVNGDSVGSDRTFYPGSLEGDQETLLYVEERKMA